MLLELTKEREKEDSCINPFQSFFLLLLLFYLKHQSCWLQLYENVNSLVWEKLNGFCMGATSTDFEEYTEQTRCNAVVNS
jgi:hypothetical protein